MLYLVICIAVLNLGLGFASGFMLRGSRDRGRGPAFQCAFSWRGRRDSKSTAASETPLADEATAASSIPALIEAVVLRLTEQLQNYRVALGGWDSDLRATQDTISSVELHERFEALREISQQYTLKQRETLQEFHGEREGLDEFAELIEELERGLNQLTSDAEGTDVQLAELESEIATTDAAQHAFQFIGSLMERLYAVERQLEAARLTVARQRHRGNLWPDELRTDHLTECQNRYGLEATVQEWWAADLERRRPLCLAAIGLDWFEQFNSAHGPLLADMLLRQTASLIEENLRPGDSLSRIGGGTFAVCLKETTVDGGVPIVERIRRLVDATRFRHADNRLKVSLSVGITPTFGSDTFDELLERAQRAIGTARTHGGNRVYAAEDTGPAEPIQISDELTVEARTIELLSPAGAM